MLQHPSVDLNLSLSANKHPGQADLYSNWQHMCQPQEQEQMWINFHVLSYRLNVDSGVSVVSVQQFVDAMKSMQGSIMFHK